LVKESKEEMKKFLAENEQARMQYENNKKMISFRYIPHHFRKPVYKAIKNLV
jgi:hypothetical protein